MDFETTYHKGVRGASELGPMAYAMHPDTEVIVASVDTGDEIIVEEPHNIDWEALCQPGDEWVSHNRTFDAAIYHRVKYDAFIGCSDPLPKPLPDPPRWNCSADLGAYLGIKRSLPACAHYLLGEGDGDEKAAKKTRDKLNRKDLAWIKANMWEELLEYAGEDAYLTREIWVQHGAQMSEHERWLSEYTTKACLRGVGIDVDFVAHHLHRMKKVVFDLEQRIPWLHLTDTKGKYYTAQSRHGLLKHCNNVGIKPPPTTRKDDPKFDAWVDEVGEEADFAKALQQVRSANKVLNEFLAISKRIDVPSYQPWIMPYALKYRGAHHGRWSGDGGWNMQNPARDARFDVKIRHVFVPRYDDTVFVVSDLSQIEARVLLWEVGDEVQLEMIRRGMDVYETHARTSMGYNSPAPLKDVNPEMRRFAKARVLGLGYGAKWKTFVTMAHTYAGLELTPRESKIQVADYAKKNPAIPRYWKSCMNRVIRESKANGGDYFEELPSGEFLNYRNVRKEKRGWAADFQLGSHYRHIHGGLLTENRISGIARDVMGYSMRLIEENPETPVMWTMHDEVICEVPRSKADEYRLEIEQKLKTQPSWAAGLPVDCDSMILERYDK